MQERAAAAAAKPPPSKWFRWGENWTMAHY